MTPTNTWPERLRPLSRVSWLLVTTVLCLDIGTAGVAHAEPPALQGWWTITGPEAHPPDVPADGLAVQGAAASPTAVAALSYPVPDRALAVTLTVTVAPQSGSVPNSTISACPLVAADFVPVQGGALAEAPAWDCAAPVTGTPGVTGATYTFAVAPLVRNGRLAVALLGGSVADRVVFSRPGSSSLDVTTSHLPPAAPEPEAPAPTIAPGPMEPPAVALQPALPPLTPAPPGFPQPPTPHMTPPVLATPAPLAAGVARAAAVSVLSTSTTGQFVMALILLALAAIGAAQRGKLLRKADERPSAHE